MIFILCIMFVLIHDSQMSQFKPPNYKLLRYETSDELDNFAKLDSIYRNIVLGNVNHLPELWNWFNSLSRQLHAYIGIEQENTRNSYSCYDDFKVIDKNDWDSVVFISKQMDRINKSITYTSYRYMSGT